MSEGLDPRDRVSLTVPAGPDQIAILRSFLGAIADHFGLADEQVDDLKVAVSEICAGARFDTDARISLEIVRDGAELDVEVSGVPPFDPDAGDGAEIQAFRRQLIGALIPQATFISAGDTMAVRFVVTPAT